MHWFMLEALFFLVAITAFVIALETGYRLGVRRQASSDEPDRTHANALHGAVLGLLALLLGFTFAMAVSRFDNRKTFMVDQANAIGTASLRGQFLPATYAAQVAPLFRAYTEGRMQYNLTRADDPALAALETRASSIENQLWSVARAVLTDDPRSQPGSLFAQALNDMFDLREKRRFALNDQVPGAVVFLLYAVSFTAMGLVSYSCGLNGRRRPLANLTFAVLIALVMIIIFDIDRPRQGFVTVSQASFERLLQSMGPATP